MIKRTNIFFLFVMLSLMLTLTFLAFPVIANASTYYVATNGSNTYPYDTWTKAATSIQTVIDAAIDNDIIIVGSSDGHGTGSYSENVVVNKQVTIQSENGYNTTTVLAANSDTPVFDVTVDNVTINGFSIYGATGWGMAAIYLNTVNGCTIQNSRCGWDGLHQNFRGIYLVSSGTCNINNTTASYNSGEGILLESSSGNTLTTNAASNNSGDGISLSTSSSNTLNGNTANNNGGDGFHLVPSSNSNTLNNNTASGNGNNGILIVASTDNNLTGNTANSNLATHGIYLVSSSNNNTLVNNTANSNMGNGIRLETSCSGNNLTSNIVTHNEFGIFLSDCSNNTISSNTMDDNDGRVDGDGIMLSGSSNNTIANNTANNDPGDGIEFYESSNNHVIGNTVINSGWGIRINYYSSNNILKNNTVNDGVKGIVVEEEHSIKNILANNTTDGNSEDGIYLYDNTSNNILTRNSASNNGYGIHLNSSSSNTIYLNNLITNTGNNVYSENGSTNTWRSPTTIYYDYNSGTFHKGYLGNYYSDGTHTGSYGIGGTYAIANDNDDDYQLIKTSGNYSLQAWWLNSDNKMYRDNVAKTSGSVTISGGGSRIWIADQAALMDIDFSGSDTWTGRLVFTSAPTNGHTFTVEIGSSTDGSDFTPGGPDATLTGDGSSTDFIFATDASAFTVSTGLYLALKMTNNAVSGYTVRTGSAWSYTSSPESSIDYSLPVELHTFSAKNRNGGVLLEWSTESECDNLGFVLESSEDNKASWQEIASYKTHDALKSKGNTSSRTEYRFTDNTVEAGLSYYYRLSDVSVQGEITTYPPIFIQLDELPKETLLEKAYPNPFNSQTYIAYHLAEETDLTITVFDMLGRSVKKLYNGHQSAGSYQVYWNGTDDKGMKAASGAYSIRMQTEKETQIQKVMFVK